MFDAGRRRGGARGARCGRLADRGEGARPDRDRDPARGGGARARSSSAPAATPRTSGSGCGGSPASLALTAPGARRRWQMQFSKWHALGNSYLVVEQPDAGPLTPARVQRLCSVATGIGSDGVLEVTHARRSACGRHDLEPRRLDRGDVRQRRAHRRALAGGGDRVRRRSRSRPRGAGSPRGCSTRSTPRPTSGRFTVGAARDRRRDRADDGLGREPARGDPARGSDPRRPAAPRPAGRDARTLPRADERAARARRRPARPHGARLGAWRGGDERVGLVVGRGRGRRGRRGWCDSPVTVHLPGRRPPRAASRTGGRR